MELNINVNADDIAKILDNDKITFFNLITLCDYDSNGNISKSETKLSFQLK